MPFHICSSTFKTHGDPLFRKISEVPSSKSHAEAHSSDCLPVGFRIISLGSVLCAVHDWQESLGGFSSIISFSCLHCSPSIFLQLFLSSSVLAFFSFSFPSSRSPTCNFPFFTCFSLLSNPFTSLSLFLCTFVCFLFFCFSSCSRLLRTVKPAATSSA